MSILDSINKATDGAVDSGEKYVKATQDYFKLKIFQQLTRSISYGTKLLVIGSFFFLGFVFLTVAGTIYLGQILNNMALSCLCMALLLFLITLIAYWQRKKFDTFLLKKMSKEYFK